MTPEGDVATAQEHTGSVGAHHSSLLSCCCCFDERMSRLPANAPADEAQVAVVGAVVVEGAMLVVVAAVVAAHVHRQEISQDAYQLLC